MKVRITEGSGWYRNKVGEVFEVVEVSEKWGDGTEYYIDPPGPTRRFILSYECEIVAESKRIMVTNGRWWYEDMVGKEFVVHRVQENYVDESLDYETEAYEVLKEGGSPGHYVLTEDCVLLGDPIGAEPEPEQEATDVVEHPSHYTSGKFEVIEIIEQVTSGYTDPYLGYCVGNTQKYIARAPHKHESPLEDLKKSRKYLDFAIEYLEGKEG